MTRSTYNAEENNRVYPGSFWTYFGPEITPGTVFNELRLTCAPDGFAIGAAHVYNDNVKVSQIFGRWIQGALAPLDRYRYDRDDPEVAIVRARIRAGSCVVRFDSVEAFGRAVLLTGDELHEANFLLDLLHPFHADDRDLFFRHFTESLGYTAPAPEAPRRFIIPGIIEGSRRRYYQRHDNPSVPGLRDAGVATLASEGWTPDAPYGPHRLHAIDVLDSPDTVTVTIPQRIYHRRKDVTASIVAVARAWHNYWRHLSSSEQAINVRMALRKHVEHAIGRAWADKPFAGAIDVFHQGERGTRERGSSEAEDWMLGNLEQWAHNWGFPAFATALAEGSNRTILETELDDYTFCHVNRDGSIADRLSNGADGITEATWDGYQDTHYPAAVNHGVEGLSTEALTIVVHQGATETAQVPVTGGLMPYEFVLTQTETWASIDEDAGEITVAPDATVGAQDYALQVRVTDDLGAVEIVSVTVTVREAASE